jgi:hypothetical protein
MANLLGREEHERELDEPVQEIAHNACRRVRIGSAMPRKTYQPW